MLTSRDSPADTGTTPAGAAALAERIVEAARALCFERGPQSVSARRIAAAVGCSATAIYRHFDSIDHVLHELRMEGQALLQRYLREPPEDLPAIERICRMQEAYYRFGREHPQYFRLMFLSRIDPARLGELASAEAATLDVVRAAAARGLEAGEIRTDLDADVIANLTWMSVHGMTSLVVNGHASVTAPGRADELLARLRESTRRWLDPSEPGGVAS